MFTAPGCGTAGRLRLALGIYASYFFVGRKLTLSASYSKPLRSSSYESVVDQTHEAFSSKDGHFEVWPHVGQIEGIYRPRTKSGAQRLLDNLIYSGARLFYTQAVESQNPMLTALL